MTNIKKVKFYNSVEMPLVGLGLYKITDEQMDQVVFDAYQNDYRHFDTAQMYHNEAALGKAWKKLGVKRDEIILTTKIDNINQGFQKTLQSFQQSCQDLQTDRLDQLLIHWPGQDAKRTVETWRALEKLYEEGFVKVIGLSNFTAKHISIIEKNNNIKPMSNQIERNPFINQLDLLSLLKKKEIVPIAWSPLKRGNCNHAIIDKLSEKYEKSASQIILRWNIESDVMIIPCSTNKQRQIENTDIFDFELTHEEIAQINTLHTGENTSFDPAIFDF